MRQRVFGIVLAAGLLLLTCPLVAHHGSASFDTEKELTLKGTVTDPFRTCFKKRPDGAIVYEISINFRTPQPGETFAHNPVSILSPGRRATEYGICMPSENP